MDRRAAALRLALLALVLLAPAAARGEAASAVCASALEREALALVNAERAALGRAPLVLDVRLTAAARRHAEDMRDGCFLAHTGSDGSSPRQRMTAAGYPDPMGEVAGAGSWPFSPVRIVDAWMDSSGHRAILTDARARHVGMGYAEDRDGCRVEPYGFWGGGFWVGTTGDAADSEFLDERCCPVPGGAPVCVPESAAGGGAAAAALTLAALRSGRRLRRGPARSRAGTRRSRPGAPPSRPRAPG